MSSEAVGGRTPRPGELEWDLNADTTSLGALGRAFKGALEKPRYFRSVVRWSAVWNRLCPEAVAMGQLTWPLALAWSWIKHTHLIFRISVAMWVTRVFLGNVLQHPRTKRRIWSLSCRGEENCLTRWRVNMNHNKESQAHAPLAGFFLGMQSSTFQLRNLGVVEFSSSARHQ